MEDFLNVNKFKNEILKVTEHNRKVTNLHCFYSATDLRTTLFYYENNVDVITKSDKLEKCR